MENIRKEYSEVLRSFEAWKNAFKELESIPNGQEDQKEAEILKSNVEKADQEWNKRMDDFSKNLHNFKNKRLSARLLAALESHSKT